MQLVPLLKNVAISIPLLDSSLLASQIRRQYQVIGVQIAPVPTTHSLTHLKLQRNTSRESVWCCAYGRHRKDHWYEKSI